MRPAEIKTRATARIEVPVQFSRIRDIAYNLWWTWSPLAHSLFYMIDPVRWVHYRSPIQLLINLEPERWQELQNDTEFIRAYRTLVERFDQYMAPEKPTWFERNYPDYDRGPIAYFSTEYGWHESLQIYSGGLGILSGDHSKSASDLGLPFVGVGLMYRHGYFRQTIDPDGGQQHFYPDYDLRRVPLLPIVGEDGKDLELSIELPGREVRFGAFKANIGRVPVLLLDTDLESNHPADRSITGILYVRGRELRLAQEILLGLGGFRLLRALGVAPSVWHMNEGHSALLSLERIAEAARLDGLSFDDARERVAGSTVFTTHTPVPAGNETFDAGLVRHYLGPWAESTGTDLDRVVELGRTDGDDVFNMTALAIRSSSRVNGVSELHGRVSGGMWNHMLESTGRTVEFVTNGVHQPTWVGPEMGDLLRKHLGPGFERRLLDPGFTEAVLEIPDDEVWEAHCAQKQRLVSLIRAQTLEQYSRHGRSPEQLHEIDHLFQPDRLTIGFARRFATYKRADLLLRDPARLKALLASTDRPIQFLFAGKAHPADKPGQELIRRIWNAALDGQMLERLHFVENYDMRIGRLLVQGVDVWLNTPRRPLEASGTSGMKAALNGGLNCSILDGWWCEGFDSSHGWAIGRQEEDHPDNEHAQDDRDADSLYRTLTDEVVDCYYQRDERGIPTEWVSRMKHAIAMLSPRFSTERMVREYTERFYLP